MTVLELFLYIILGLFLQIAIFAGMAFHRHWQVYQELKHRLANSDTLPSPLPSWASPIPMPKNQESLSQGWTGLREFRVQRKIFENNNQSVCSFHLAPTDGQGLPSFKPGQYLTFQFHDPLTGQSKKISRCYSLSDRPGLNHYRVSIKRVPAPAGSTGVAPGLASNAFHDHIQEGSLLQVQSPSGLFFLEEDESPVVMVAGGIGITPMLSMIHSSLHRNPTRELWLFQGITHSDEHVMRGDLETLAIQHPNFHLHTCYSRPLPSDIKGKDYHHKGHADITLLRLTLPLKPFRFYICGPEAMMNTMVPALKAWGVPEEHIHYELFGPASVSPPPLTQHPATHSKTVLFNTSGKSVIWNDHTLSLLQLAEQNAIRVDSGCRAGVCGMCQTTLLQGEVTYMKPPEFDPKPDQCRLCITQPKTDLTLQA